MEQGLITRLLADSGLSALVGTDIYPVSRPQGSSLPALTLATVSNEPVYTDQGETGLAAARVQIDCWGETYPSVKSVARAVQASLSGFVGTVSGVEFQSVLLDGERDLRESGSNAAEYLFRAQLDFTIMFKS